MPEAAPVELADITAGPVVDRTARHRYPWEVWGVPGAGPFLVSSDEIDTRRLSGVLRTWAARRSIVVRIKTLPEGLLFQFGPPFSPVLQTDVQPVEPGTDVTVEGCPTCHQKWPPVLERKDTDATDT